MSDPIECRFIWYRQVNIANFFISTKQLLQAEKKIRCLSLLQQQALLSAFQLTTENFSEVCGKNEDVLWLIEYLSKVSLDDLSETDANTVVFVSSCIGRSVSRSRSCFSCKQLLIAGADTL